MRRRSQHCGRLPDFEVEKTECAPEVRALSSAGITRLHRSYDPVRLPPWPPPDATSRPLPSPPTSLPRLPGPPFQRAEPPTPADRAGPLVDCFPARAAFPKWPEGRHPHCTRVTARRIAQPPTATFVTRLRPFRLPGRAARQLPDQSTTLWVDSSSTSGSRLRGAQPHGDVTTCVAPDDVAYHIIVKVACSLVG